MRVWNSEVMLLGRSVVVWAVSGVDFLLVIAAELLLLIVALAYTLSQFLEWIVASIIGDSPYQPDRLTSSQGRSYVRAPSIWYTARSVACLRKWTDCLSGRARCPAEFLRDDSSQTDETPPNWEYRICKSCEEKLYKSYQTHSRHNPLLESRTCSPDSTAYLDSFDYRRDRPSPISDEEHLAEEERLTRTTVPPRGTRLRALDRRFLLSRHKSPVKIAPVRETRVASLAVTRASLIRKISGTNATIGHS